MKPLQGPTRLRTILKRTLHCQARSSASEMIVKTLEENWGRAGELSPKPVWKV